MHLKRLTHIVTVSTCVCFVFQVAHLVVCIVVCVQSGITLAQQCDTPSSEDFDREGFFNTEKFLDREHDVLGLSPDVQETASHINL